MGASDNTEGDIEAERLDLLDTDDFLGAEGTGRTLRLMKLETISLFLWRKI